MDSHAGRRRERGSAGWRCWPDRCCRGNLISRNHSRREHFLNIW